jgi:hypothetical protein
LLSEKSELNLRFFRDLRGLILFFFTIQGGSVVRCKKDNGPMQQVFVIVEESKKASQHSSLLAFWQ